MNEDKQTRVPFELFNRLLADKLGVLSKKIEILDYVNVEYNLSLEVILSVMGYCLTSIQQSNVSNKKKLKFELLDEVIRMINVMKEHRADLHMEDHE